MTEAIQGLETVKSFGGEGRLQRRNKSLQFTKSHQVKPLIPGMTVVADITTGRQTVLDYLLKPIRKGLSDSLTER